MSDDQGFNKLFVGISQHVDRGPRITVVSPSRRILLTRERAMELADVLVSLVREIEESEGQCA